jgi:NAD(P)-dependent dehydrogenase (short-subunit alcohol dehydrogenase family)
MKINPIWKYFNFCHVLRDILVNNAGIAHVGNIENTVESDMDKVYEVNIKGVYNCIRAVIPRIKESGGVILNMASIASSAGISDRFAYSMSKGAVLTMSYSIAKDYIAMVFDAKVFLLRVSIHLLLMDS